MFVNIILLRIFYRYCVKRAVCQDKNLIAGMHGKVDEHVEEPDLSYYDHSDIDSDHRNPRYDTCFNLLLRRRIGKQIQSLS